MQPTKKDVISWFAHAALAVALQCLIVAIFGNDKPVLWWVGAAVASAAYANRERLQYRQRIEKNEAMKWPIDSTFDLLFPIAATTALAWWATSRGWFQPI